eukprot:2444248-Prymnesium_polylepis.1
MWCGGMRVCACVRACRSGWRSASCSISTTPRSVESSSEMNSIPSCAYWPREEPACLGASRSTCAQCPRTSRAPNVCMCALGCAMRRCEGCRHPAHELLDECARAHRRRVRREKTGLSYEDMDKIFDDNCDNADGHNDKGGPIYITKDHFVVRGAVSPASHSFVPDSPESESPKSVT